MQIKYSKYGKVTFVKCLELLYGNKRRLRYLKKRDYTLVRRRKTKNTRKTLR